MSNTDITLVIVVLGLAIAMIAGVALSERRQGGPAKQSRERVGFFGAGIFAWLAITGIAGVMGYLREVNSFPPPALRLLIPSLVMVIYLATSRFGGRLARGLHFEEIIGFQAFRLPVEMILLGYYFENRIPVLMTLEGRNYDVVTAVTALLVAFLLYTGNLNRKIIWAWNILGLGLLFNILLIAMLTTPGPYQQIKADPGNSLPLTWPSNWILFCVLTALFSHLLVFRKLANR